MPHGTPNLKVMAMVRIHVVVHKLTKLTAPCHTHTPALVAKIGAETKHLTRLWRHVVENQVRTVDDAIAIDVFIGFIDVNLAIAVGVNNACIR